MFRPAQFVLYRQSKPMVLAAALALAASTVPAAAKTPGHTYCFLGFCHRVLTLAETQDLVGKQTLLSTSNYDDCSRDRFNPCGLTSSGAVFQADRPDNAASPIYPDGTIILARHPKTQKSAVLRVHSAGPYHGKRLLDVSRAAAEVMGFSRQGVANLEVRIVQAPSKAEASYKKNRVYPAVPGYIGAFASIDEASVRYAALTGDKTLVAGIYPQSSAPNVTTLPSIVANGVERTWLAKAVTFKPSRIEAKLNKKTSIKLGRLDRKLRHLGVGRVG